MVTTNSHNNAYRFKERLRIYDTPCEVFRKFGFSKTYRCNRQNFDVPMDDYIRLYSVITYVDIAYNEFLSIINDKSLVYLDTEEKKAYRFILDRFHMYFTRILYQKSEQGEKLMQFFDIAQEKWTETMAMVELSVENTGHKYISNDTACRHFSRLCRVFNYLELSEYMRDALHYVKNDNEFLIIERQVHRLLCRYIDRQHDHEAVIEEVANHFSNINRIIIPTFHNIKINEL